MPTSKEYDYELPRDLIAQHPLPCRSDARLMVVDRRSGSWQHAHVRDLPEILKPTDALVINDTRVLPARLVGYRSRTGGKWSGLFLDVNEEGHWQVLGKTRGAIEPGETVTLQDREARDVLELVMIAPMGGGLWVAKPKTEEPPLSVLDQVGRVPLPPYIRGGEMVDADSTQYQTIYADIPGAIAAPTAGLHFTRQLLDETEARGIQIHRVTLHVGLGTFRPISAARIEDHGMHAEWSRVDSETAAELAKRRRRGGRIVAVGTTVVRALETAAHQGQLAPWSGTTDLYIHPPYEFRAVDVLLTNFHLPKTSLLVLVRTFGGDELIADAYREAIREQYRFFSYGDAMLIL